jgi:hypothetical protein
MHQHECFHLLSNPLQTQLQNGPVSNSFSHIQREGTSLAVANRRRTILEVDVGIDDVMVDRITCRASARIRLQQC